MSVQENIQMFKHRWEWLMLQGRRRRRMAPDAYAVAPDKLGWDWQGRAPYRWNIWISLDGGATWSHPEDYWTTGDDREFWPDGGSYLHLVVGVDESGNEITERSNGVIPDSVLPTLLTDLLAYWDGDSANDSVASLAMQQAGTGSFGVGTLRPDGSTGVFEAPYESDLFYSKSAVFDDFTGRTVNAWVMWYVDQGMMLLADMGDSGNGYVTRSGVRWCPDGLFYDTYSYNGTGWDVDSIFPDPFPWASYTWVMLTMTHDDLEWKIYVDGALQSTTAKTDPTGTYLADGPESFYLNGPHPFGNFTGQFCYVGVWNRVLSGAEIAQLYNSGDGLAYAGL